MSRDRMFSRDEPQSRSEKPLPSLGGVKPPLKPAEKATTRPAEAAAPASKELAVKKKRGKKAKGTAPGSGVPVGERLAALDAYRGLIMLAMASAGLGIPAAVKELNATTGFWAAVAGQLDHASWAGCTTWDLIQPAFMFMVGVAAAYSYASRQARGDTFGKMARHAALRSLVLVLLGVFLSSAHASQTNFVFTNVLAQIGLGYFVVFLLRARHWAIQASAIVFILSGYWFLFYRYPAPQPGPGLDLAAYGLPGDWPLYSGLFGHWNKNLNFAAWFDGWFLNLFPRPAPFRFSDGGYQTLNFLPAIVTMLFGLLAGERLRSSKNPRKTLFILGAAAVVLLGLGVAAGATICPSVKRIWTPSWTLFSGGWALALLMAFYGVVDVAGYRRWTFPLVVVGMNCLLMYLMSQLMRGWTISMFHVHVAPLLQWGPASAVLRFVFGPNGMNPAYQPIVNAVSALTVFWLICWWLHRRRIFVRI